MNTPKLNKINQALGYGTLAGRPVVRMEDIPLEVDYVLEVIDGTIFKIERSSVRMFRTDTSNIKEVLQ